MDFSLWERMRVERLSSVPASVQEAPVLVHRLTGGEQSPEDERYLESNLYPVASS